MKRLTRAELYELVWSKPMRTLAPDFGISDVALRKACVRAVIPVPERGHWARLQAGKRVIRAKLSPRPAGLAEELEIGGNRYAYRTFTDAELLAPPPPPPTFAEPIEQMEQEIRRVIGKVKPVSSLDAASTPIRRLLAQDEERKEKQRTSSYVMSWDRPYFTTGFELRRLKILESLFRAVRKAGGAPEIRGKAGREISVRIHDTVVSLRLDSPDNLALQLPYDRPHEAEDRAPLKLLIATTPGSSKERFCWEESKGNKLDQHLTEIAVHLSLAAELQYREGVESRHSWLLTRRGQRIEEIRLAKEAAARHEQERQERLAQEEVDRLLAEADDLQRAETIRSYVARVQKITDSSADAKDKTAAWAAWANAVADRIDPTVGRRYLDGDSL